METYLTGKAEPKASRLAAIAGAVGMSVHWLVVGEGPMMVVEMGKEESSDHWNAPLMRQVIEAVEIALQQTEREMDPEDKATLILSVYDLYSEANSLPDSSKIIRLVRSAA